MMTRNTLGALLLVYFVSVYADNECRPVYLKQNRSSVCVCTAEYCDDITRERPLRGEFVMYSSSEAGLRFKKQVGRLQPYYYNLDLQGGCIAKGGCKPALYLDTRTQYQTIMGFGGAVTDSVGIHWKSMDSEKLKQRFIDTYFSEQGLQYNMLRVPIGGSDFSTHAYAYNDLPINDINLSNFTLTEEDFEYKIPVIKECFKAATAEVHIVSNPWSPPAWMKDNNNLSGFSRLLPQYYQTYADYYLRFLQEYEKAGVPIWAITTTNEPTNGVINAYNATFNTLGWIMYDQGKWIADHLGPTIRNSSFKDVKILCNDDQRNHLYSYFTFMVSLVPTALQYIDGVAVHFYLDNQVPPEMITYTMKDFPDKFIMSTEACAGANLQELDHVDLGSWKRAQLYISDIIENLNYNLTGWIDWNMCLDEQGGPNWVSNFVDSPIIISKDKRKFYKQPMYYAIGHASKFLPRGSRRIKVNNLCENTVPNVSFLTPDGTVVTILHNTGEETVVYLVTGNKLAMVPIQRNSIVTVEFLQQ